MRVRKGRDHSELQMYTDRLVSRSSWLLLLFVFGVVTSACGEGSSTSSSGTGGDATTSGTAGGGATNSGSSGSSTNNSTGGAASGTGGTGAGGNVGGGGSPECPPDQKPCGGTCVPTNDPKFGCADPMCTPCGNEHSTSACEAGACSVVDCEAEWSDCDGNGQNGCEANLPADPNNCDTCGNTCSAPNGTPGCEAGVCTLSSCDNSWSDCNGELNDGCEIQSGIDPANCGSCGVKCGAGETCQGGVCGVFCDPGKGNCDGNAPNGCETTLGTQSDCAFCGDSCDLANATGMCQGGACAIVMCQGGFANCDANPANGCETSLSTASNCGACGVGCGLGENCIAGQCAAPNPCAILPEVCNGLDDNCDGQVDENLTEPCSTACGSGVIACTAGKWGACSAPQPTAEVCGNTIDDDCDGNTDDVALVNGQMKTCASGCGNTSGTLGVSIGNVTDLTTVATPLNVTGTVTGAIDSWYLEWAPDGETAYTLLQSGTGNVISGALGALDPTLIENGIIHLRLRAVGCNSAVVQDVRDVKIAGENKVGNVIVTYEDMKIEVVGVAVQVLRMYDSRKRALKKEFGQEWSLSLGTKVNVSRNIPVGQSWTLTCPPIFGQPTQTEIKGHDIEVRLNEHELYRFKPVISNITYAFQGACQGYVTFQQTGGRPGQSCNR
ncbi:MAG: hypothetical protein IPK82_44375 [Polyangiaceae bacterium]|nr:hypothetical protein [Polyangiaceae bacterium]